MIERNMIIPELAIEKEHANKKYIYLFNVEDNWQAFGYSAYYLHILYPELRAGRERIAGSERQLPCVSVPNRYLSKMSDIYYTLVSDAYVQMEVPLVAYIAYKDYDKWCDKLEVNECKPLILEH